MARWHLSLLTKRKKKCATPDQISNPAALEYPGTDTAWCQMLWRKMKEKTSVGLKWDLTVPFRDWQIPEAANMPG